MHTNAFDEALSIPTCESARLARNTQLILQQEAGLCDVVDPWGGSWMMESLTARMVEKAKRWLDQIEEQGGVVAAIQSGWVHKVIHEQALQTQADIDSGQRTIVGVNHYESATDAKAEIRSIDSTGTQAEQRKRLSKLKVNRDSSKVRLALSALSKGAETPNTNLLALTVDAIRARATVGECIQALTEVWPRHETRNYFLPCTYAQGRGGDSEWHRVEQEVLAYSRQRKKKPSILLVKLGLDGHDRGIQTVAAGLNDLGFYVTLGSLFNTPEQVIEQLKHGDFDVLGTSMLSGAHLPLLRELSTKIRKTYLNPPLFLGGIIPEHDEVELKLIGVKKIYRPGDKIENIGSDILKWLTRSDDCGLRVQAEKI